jgi:hypothetical protein
MRLGGETERAEGINPRITRMNANVSTEILIRVIRGLHIRAIRCLLAVVSGKPAVGN